MSEIWQFISENALVIIGLFIAAIAVFVKLCGPRWIAQDQEKKGKLERHFEDTREEIEDSILDEFYDLSDFRLLTTPFSRVYLMGDSAPRIIGYTPAQREELFQSFKCHFPSESREREELVARRQTHNQKVDDFEAELKKFLKEETGFAVMNYYDSSFPVPYIDSRVLQPLFQDWNVFILGGKPSSDFAQATTKVINESGLPLVELRVKEYPCGMFSESSEAENCKSALIRMQNNPQFIQKATELCHNGQDIAENFTLFSNRLRSTLGDIARHKQFRKKFKELKNCPVCQKFIG